MQSDVRDHRRRRLGSICHSRWRRQIRWRNPWYHPCPPKREGPAVRATLPGWGQGQQQCSGHGQVAACKCAVVVVVSAATKTTVIVDQVGQLPSKELLKRDVSFVPRPPRRHCCGFVAINAGTPSLSVWSHHCHAPARGATVARPATDPDGSWSPRGRSGLTMNRISSSAVGGLRAVVRVDNGALKGTTSLQHHHVITASPHYYSKCLCRNQYFSRYHSISTSLQHLIVITVSNISENYLSNYLSERFRQRQE